ncbi:hypothetical protein CSN29_21690 [Salmonella enterica subsp. diarizonae]|nr:hypothetical protein [Salmonella enterica]ECC3883428.1 hypothetical protein [Salmonella enterica subsp. diarizonae]ECJ4780221.1 hypothetical protein [Salmonella enterica subsp. diarizonae]ECQ2678804.1 hypothetical protein [Salmonella enterica]EDQ7408542.1 hypothetical protein [Salmonella enterica subsp. diarizonae]
MRAGSRGRGKTQHTDENAADGVAHVVFPGGSAPERFRQILFYLFSDLRQNENFLLNSHHKNDFTSFM